MVVTLSQGGRTPQRFGRVRIDAGERLTLGISTP